MRGREGGSGVETCEIGVDNEVYSWGDVRMCGCVGFCFFFSSRRRHTRYIGDWSSDVCSSDLEFSKL